MGPVPTALSRRNLTSLCIFLVFVAWLCTGLLLRPYIAHATDSTITNPEYTEALERLNDITDEYTALSEQQDLTLSQLEEIRAKITNNDARIEDVQREIEDRQDEIAGKQRALASYISATYKTGKVSLLSIILSASSFEDAVSKFYYYDVICEKEVKRIDVINAAKEKLHDQQRELNRLKKELHEQENSLKDLSEQQLQQAEVMSEQQVAAAELLNSLPKDVQTSLDDTNEELIAETQSIIQTEQEESGSARENEQKSSSNDSHSDNNQRDGTSGSQVPAMDDPSPSSDSSTDGSLQTLMDAAYSTSEAEALSKGWGCAGWIYTVFRNSGLYTKKPSCAAWYYNNWCYSSDRNVLRPGMVIAVSTHTRTSAGKIYGHVGIYVGNNTVRHYTGSTGRISIQNVPLEQWIRTYGTTVAPRWGWLGNIELS